MSEYTLTLLDTTSIQKYIFSSNRLKEIIGASFLVRQVTQQWTYEALDDLFPGEHNVTDLEKGTLDEAIVIAPGTPVKAEVIFSGGGNTAILFREEVLAHKFAYHLTKRLLQEAPGLELVVAHIPLTANDSLAEKIRQGIDGFLAAAKQQRRHSLPLPGLGVTAVCSSTGLPAASIDTESDGRRISRVIQAKLKACKPAQKGLNQAFADLLEKHYRFPDEFDHLGREMGEESYLAVVHIDGNAMGARVRSIAQHYASPGQNHEYKQAMRQFSHSIEDASNEALRSVVSELLRQDPDDLAMYGDYLPFRPLIFGGDDITFVCNGRYGLALAALYLQVFEQQKLKGVPDNEQQPFACAGVSVVKMHYPFSRAADLSYDLCDGAKECTGPDRKASALDWHFSTSGLNGSLKVIRQREYEETHGSLALRPLRLKPEPFDQDGRAWFERVEPLVRVFQKDPEWQGHRNKIKALREALRAGPGAVEEFRRTYRLPDLPELIPGRPEYRQTGWANGLCGYFDVIELIDHYRPLR